jgi:hypothetical protein
VVCRQMDAFGGHNAKWNKSCLERQKPSIFSHTWKIDQKNKHTHKKTWSYTNFFVEHVCNCVTTLWNLEKEEKEKRVIEHQQYCKI